MMDTAEKYYSYMFRYEALEAENAALRADIAEMEDVARQADSVSRENQRLRAMLEFKETHESYNMVDAYIDYLIRKNPKDFEYVPFIGTELK